MVMNNQQSDVASLAATLTPLQKDALIDFLSGHVTRRRRARMAEVLRWRTRFLTVVLEDVYQPHNASAVLRSCEIFGVQDVHVIEQENRFRPNRGIALGATQWLTVTRYADSSEAGTTRRCLTGLKERGYRIAAMTLRPGSTSPRTLPLDAPVALCFGTEEDGLSDEAHALADTYVQLPMYGFTHSFNISVTAALSLYELVNRLHDSNVNWGLTDEEKRELRLRWLLLSATQGEILARHFLQEKGWLNGDDAG